MEEGVGAGLISLDARRAFDSVNHHFIYTIIKNYGFGKVKKININQ
jgi:hypothetical protein